MGSMLNIASRMEGPEQKTIIGKPEITVSAKGIANGKSVYLNDGADFGPDTKLGATTSKQYGPPYTQSYGLVEASEFGNSIGGCVVKLNSGTFYTSVQIPLYDYVSFEGVGVNTIIKSTAAAGLTLFKNPQFFATHKNFHIVSASSGVGQLAWGFDVSQTSELGGNITLEKITFDGIFSSGWFKSDKSDQFRVVSIYPINQTGMTTAFSAVQSEFVMKDSYMEGAGVALIGHDTAPQTFINCQTDTLKLMQSSIALIIRSGYTNDGKLPLLDMNSNGLNYLYAEGMFGIGSTNNFLLNTGAAAVTLNVAEFHGVFVMDSTGAWLSTGITVTTYSNSAIVRYAGSTQTTMSGYPFFTGGLLAQGFGITTPAVPASGTNVQNTTAYPVRIYITGAGTTTAYTITDPAGNTLAISAALTLGQEITLDTNASINITYTTAPTWKWYGSE